MPPAPVTRALRRVIVRDRKVPSVVTLTGGMPFDDITVAVRPAPRRLKADVGGGERCRAPSPARSPCRRSPRLPAIRSTSATGKLCRSTVMSRAPAPSGTLPRASAARPPPAVTRASRPRRPSVVVPRAVSETGGRPALRVMVEATSAAAMSKRTSGAPRGPVTRAVPLIVPARPEVGPDGVGEGERHGGDRHVDVEGLGHPALRGQAAGAEVELQRRQVDRAVADGDRRRRGQRRRDALLAQAQRVEPGGEAAVEPLQLAREVGERADRQAALRLELHGRRVGLRSPSRRSEAISTPPTTRSLPRSVPLTSGRPRASLTCALASSEPTRVAPTTTSRACAVSPTPWPTLGRLGGGEVDPGIDRRPSPRRAPGPPAARCRARRARRVPGRRRGPVLREVAGQPVRPDPDVEPRDRPPLAGEATSPPRARTRPSRPPEPSTVPVTVDPSTCPLKPRRALVSVRSISRPSGTAADERHRDRPPVAGGMSAGGQPPRHPRIDEREVGERGVEADVGPRARDRAVRGEGELGVVDAQVLGADAALVADRPPRDRGGAGEQGVEAGVADGEVVTPPSKVRSKPPLSGVTLPFASRSTAARERAVGDARRRPRRRRRGSALRPV